MAPTETELLANYLIQPSSLTAVITLEQFKTLFPRPLQSSPQVRSLFRDLQVQRTMLLDVVAENIDVEARRGVVMRREVVRARRETEREDVDAEIEMERAVRSCPSYNTVNDLLIFAVVWQCVWRRKCQAQPCLCDSRIGRRNRRSRS